MSADRYRPRLRDGVTITPAPPDDDAPGERGTMELAASGHRITFGPTAWSVVRNVDGRRDVDELASAAGGESSRAIALAVVRQLALLNALDGAGDDIVERLVRLRSGEEQPPTIVLDGARFECQGSGECCQNYWFGPLKDSDVARLEALPLAEAFPHVEPPYVVVETVGTDSPQRYLRAIDNTCVFLDERGRCGIHARFGAAAKPDLCRLYPIDRLVTWDGIRTSDAGSCATFAVSSRRGLPLVDALPSLRPLFYGTNEIFHPLVVLPGLNLDFGHYLRLVRPFLDVARSGRANAPETLRAIGRSLQAALPVLADLEPRPGEPDATVAALAARSWEPFFEAGDDEEAIARGAAVVERVAERLIEKINRHMATRWAAAGPDGRMSAMGLRLPRELCEILVVLRIAARAVVEGELPADPYFGQILAVSIGDADSDEALRLSIRQQLFARHAVVDDHGVAALLHVAFIQLCAIVGARLSAAAAGRARARDEDFSRGHMLAVRVVPAMNAYALFVEEEEHAWDVLEAMPALARWG